MYMFQQKYLNDPLKTKIPRVTEIEGYMKSTIFSGFQDQQLHITYLIRLLPMQIRSSCNPHLLYSLNRVL